MSLTFSQRLQRSAESGSGSRNFGMHPSRFQSIFSGSGWLGSQMRRLKSKNKKSIDMYGQPFMLTFKGEKQDYKIKEIIIQHLQNKVYFQVSVTLAYLIFQLQKMFSNSHIITSVNYSVWGLNFLINDNKTSRFVVNQASVDNPDMIDLYSLGFDVAFGGYQDIDPRYGSVTAQHFTKQREYNETTGEPYYTYETEDLETVKCGFEHFNYPRKNESAYGDVESLLCIKDKSKLRIGGAWTTNRLEQINIALVPCVNTSTSKNCATPAQILFINE